MISVCWVLSRCLKMYRLQVGQTEVWRRGRCKIPAISVTGGDVGNVGVAWDEVATAQRKVPMSSGYVAVSRGSRELRAVASGCGR